MPEIMLSIIKIGDAYRALIHVGKAVNLVHGKVVFKCSKFISKRAESGDAIRQLKEEAKEWARENKIPFVANLDFNPYE